MYTAVRFAAAFALMCVSICCGAVIDTFEIRSRVLGRIVPYLTVRPSSYTDAPDAGSRYPVVYLLHCAGCTHLSWLDSNYCNGLPQSIDSVRCIAVAPFDGTTTGWWLDSPVREYSGLSRFLVEELKPHIDSLFATCPGRDATALAGHSMGGFGSLHNAMRCPQVFGIAVGIKSAVDLLNPSWPDDFGLEAVLGAREQQRSNWEWATVLSNARLFTVADVNIRLYNGTSDSWFYDENVRLHHALDSLAVPHEYMEVNEDHFTISSTVVRGALNFCDTASRCGPAESRRPVPLHNFRFPAATGALFVLMVPDRRKYLPPENARLFNMYGQCFGKNLDANTSPGVYIAAVE
jgi:S-formylglutathione hydrolase FrmB